MYVYNVQHHRTRLYYRQINLLKTTYSFCRSKVTDYGMLSFLCGQDFQESEADQYKRKKSHSALSYLECCL